MVILLTVLVALVSLGLILIVLVQNPKGGGLNSAFGGSQTASQLLGAANTTDILERITWGLASALLVLCLAIYIMFKPTAQMSGSRPDVSNVEQPMQAPTAPADPATAPAPAPAPTGN